MSFNPSDIAWLFFLFTSFLILFSAFKVVSTAAPVSGVLFLVLTFFCSTVLWLFLDSEFLALVLIFVYIGAVMTLFLFVVMMLNVEQGPSPYSGKIWLFMLMILFCIFGSALWFILNDAHFASYPLPWPDIDMFKNNTQAIGEVLYTDYMLAFEIAAVILVVSIVGAVTLSFRREERGIRKQNVEEQLSVTKKQRLRILKLEVEHK